MGGQKNGYQVAKAKIAKRVPELGAISLENCDLKYILLENGAF